MLGLPLLALLVWAALTQGPLTALLMLLPLAIAGAYWRELIALPAISGSSVSNMTA